MMIRGVIVHRSILFLALMGCAQMVEARPNFADTLNLGHSIVMVTTELPSGDNGRGSGVVVSKEYVATNCHVIANTNGANIAKFRDGYRPIAIKANWRRDLCLLKFDPLPFTPLPMRDSSTLQYEEEVFSLGFPAGANVPQPSYGNIKGKYMYDGSLIVRSDASFAMGSSGGALFDAQFNLIGITTFKSPGHDGFYYSLPVEWIKELMNAPETFSLKTQEVPFWALPLEQRPYFMRVVIPFQNKEWGTLKGIANQWIVQEPNSVDAWYFLGVAEEGTGELELAKLHLNKAYQLNRRDLDAMLALSRVAFAQKDVMALESLEAPVKDLNQDEGENIALKIKQLKLGS
ncbi:S1 family peptidase [Methylotenera sp. N17]|uniref:S1 family peptidase n=1 Tax=Methylotenera sp. N17 TaxID=1502761 RepID=UPI001F20DC62|nr:serine protease [Methylotenera sp. N17]